VRRVTLLGATGSIGRSTADLLRAHGDRFSLDVIVGGKDVAALAALAREFRPQFVAVADPDAGPALTAALAGTGMACGAGAAAVLEAAERPADIVVAAIVGTAGLLPTAAALKPGRRVALANKECLVTAGAPFMGEARRKGVELLPVDSEHNAIFQALGGHGPDEVEAMVLTASGGPFRTWSRERIAAAGPEEAIAHPNWSMGAKISVDSASLMNKGLEVIEAHHLFGIPADRIKVVVHPQSVVHGLVSFADGSVVAGLALPDMRVPIAHCLGFPSRLPTAARRLDLARLGRLDFEEPDLERFPALSLARQALEAGGAFSTVLNAANEIAVGAFLAGRIRFGAIPVVVAETLERLAGRSGSVPASIEDALAIDHVARIEADAALRSAAEQAH
jgi:1-deoxy-D-xylulose-5-phosphate reductoisomerase